MNLRLFTWLANHTHHNQLLIIMALKGTEWFKCFHLNIIYLKELCPEATWGGGSIKLHPWIGGEQWQFEVNSKQIKLVKEAQPVPLLNLHVNTNGHADYCHSNEWRKHTSCCFYTDQCFFFYLTKLIAASHSKLSLFIDCSFAKM